MGKLVNDVGKASEGDLSGVGCPVCFERFPFTMIADHAYPCGTSGLAKLRLSLRLIIMRLLRSVSQVSKIVTQPQKTSKNSSHITRIVKG